MMPLVVFATALPMIRRRRLEQSRDALAAGACAIVFLTVSIIFDDMSFPHVPYIFLTSSAFVAVLYQRSTSLDALATAAQTPVHPRPLRHTVRHPALAKGFETPADFSVDISCAGVTTPLDV